MPNDLPAPDGAEDLAPIEEGALEDESTEEITAPQHAEFESGVGFDDEPVADFNEPEVEEDIDTDVIRDGGHRVRDDIGREAVDQVSRSVARVGRKIRYRVTRIEPSDLPVTELGVSDWFTLASTKPTGEDLQDDLRKRFGGGRYHVEIRPLDSTDESDSKEEVTVELGGEPRMQTHQGRQWYIQQHGFLPAGEDGQPMMEAGTSGGMGMFMQMLAQQQKQMEDRMERERREMREARQNEGNVLAELVRSQSQSRGPGMGEILTGVAALAGALVPVLTEGMRSRRESEERKEERESRRFEELLKRFEDGKGEERGPGEMMGMLQAYTKIIEEGARGQMAVQSKAMEQMMSQAIKRMSESGDSEGAGLLGAFTEMLRENGGDLLRQGMALVANRAGQQQVDPRIAQAYAQQQAAAQQQAMQQGQPQPQTAQPLPDGTQPVEGVQPEQPQGPTPEQQAMQIGLQSMAGFVMTLRTLIHQQPDADTAWVTNYAGQPMETLFGNAIKPFRQRVVESAESGVVSVAAWVDGVNEPQLLAAAGEIDDILSKDKEAQEWFADFLAKGPWIEEEDEDDDGSEEDSES